MFDEPLAINISEESCPVTAVISHVVRPGREQGYEAWFHRIAADARKFKGHLGVSTIRPQDHAHPEYVVIRPLAKLLLCYSQGFAFWNC
ncbi:hypothetical protein [Nostoc sp. FACHB-888]|uniref:hypothetical protein n=1 Tax=Nostoc sp. FACHB-888 TaxID=2692842 RepID=UPI0018EFB810|nr:hypothetical protein [Nostoc sp. FACHB-888]